MIAVLECQGQKELADYLRRRLQISAVPEPLDWSKPAPISPELRLIYLDNLAKRWLRKAGEFYQMAERSRWPWRKRHFRFHADLLQENSRTVRILAGQEGQHPPVPENKIINSPFVVRNTHLQPLDR